MKPDFERLLNEAKEAESRKDYAAALPVWRQLSMHARKAKFLWCYALAAQKCDFWQEAEDALHKAIALEPESALTRELLGNLSASRNDREDDQAMEEAIRWFNAAIEIEPKAGTFTMLGATYVQAGKDESARLSFEQALLLDPDYEEAMWNLAKLLKDEDADRAAELLERAIEIDPGYWQAQQLLGVISHRRADLVKADRHLSRAVELCPEDVFNLLFLANLRSMESRKGEAKRLYEEALRLTPEDETVRSFYDQFLSSWKDAT